MMYRMRKTLALSLGTLLLGTSLAFAAMSGTVTGVDEKGVATVKTADGKEHKIYPGDMWQKGTKVECAMKEGQMTCQQPK
jgi:hypothetical protein